MNKTNIFPKNVKNLSKKHRLRNLLIKYIRGAANRLKRKLSRPGKFLINSPFYSKLKRLYNIFFVNMLINRDVYSIFLRLIIPGEEYFEQLINYVTFCTSGDKNFHSTPIAVYFKHKRPKGIDDVEAKQARWLYARRLEHHNSFQGPSEDNPYPKPEELPPQFRGRGHPDNLRVFSIEYKKRRKFILKNFVMLALKVQRPVARSK